MTSAYRIAINAEWTSKCNARCAMCPRDAIEHPQLMTVPTWRRVLSRIDPHDVFRVVIAGYGEPTTHPRFHDFVDAMRGHSVRFDLVSNGQLLDADRLIHLDGTISTLLISFSSIDPDVYRRVHVNLDHRRVMDNIESARRILKRTTLGISLTPMPECLPSLPDTIAWLRGKGIGLLTMSPTLYNRAGELTDHALASARLRRIIREHGLRSQEFDFIPSCRALFQQWRRNRLKCVPRNVDLLIAASGEYLYCYNDIGHRHAIGHVNADAVRAVLLRREAMDAVASLCGQCNMRDRYRGSELIRAGLTYARTKLGMCNKLRAG